MNTDPSSHAEPSPSPMAVVGVILAQGVIRLIDRQNRLARVESQRPSTHSPTHDEEPENDDEPR